MKNRYIPLVALTLQAVLSWVVPGAYAQSIGIGAGLALPNDQIAQVTADLAASGWSGAVENASDGYYVELRGRMGGQLALIGSVGYNRFAEARSQYFDGSNHSVELITSQTIVPVTLGAEMRLSEGFLVPYLTLEGSYNQYYRTFERTSGDFSVPFDVQSNGESRIGAAVGAGLTMDLKIMELAAGARLHLPNLLNADPAESEIYYLQIGATAFFKL